MDTDGDDKLLLTCYSWVYHDQLREKDEYCCIHGWCFNRDSTPHLVIIKNYLIHLYIELPATIKGRDKEWTQEEADEVGSELYNSSNGLFDGYESEQQELMYYYKAKYSSPLLKLLFRRHSDIKKFMDLYCEGFLSSYGELFFNFMEHEIDPVRKFLTDINLDYAQWFNVSGFRVPHNRQRSVNEHEYYINWKTIKGIDVDETVSWFTKPLWLSFDIESHSHNLNAFPDEYNIEDVSFITGFSIWRDGDSFDLIKRIAVVFGDCLDKVKNVNEIYIVKKEADYIDLVFKLFRRINPDCVTGYNILSFDFSYMKVRCVTWVNKIIPNVGRLKKYPYDRKTLYVDESWSSKAKKKVNIKYVEMEGRVIFDVFNYVKDMCPGHPSYKLAYISQKFLGETKDDVTPKEMFIIYNRYLKYKKMVKRGKLSKSSSEYIEMLTQMARVVHYCCVDCDLPLKLIKYFGCWAVLGEMARICELNHEKIFKNGTSQRSQSLVYNGMKKAGFVLNRFESTIVKPQGAHVFPPIVGFHRYISYHDFASLYPSLIIRYNLCYTTLILQQYFGNFSADDFDIHKIPRPDGLFNIFGIVKRNIREGVLPQIMRKLLASRKAVRAKQRTIQDKSIWAIYESRQLALKIVANAAYGYCASDFNKFPIKEIGELITGLGRYNIQLMAKCASEAKNGTVVYGDTDSFMMRLNDATDGLDCVKKSNELTAYINGSPDILDDEGNIIKKGEPGLLEAPLFMDKEHDIDAIFLKKKNYIYAIRDQKTGELIRDKDGKIELHMKGVPAVKKENPIMMKDHYEEQCLYIFNGKDFKYCITKFLQVIRLYTQGKIPLSRLSMINVMGTGYASPTYALRVFGDRLAEKGQPVEAGELLEYLVIDIEGATRKGDRMYLVREYEEAKANGEEMKLHDEFYISKIMGKIGELLCIIFDPEKKAEWTLGRKKYTLSRLGVYVYDMLKGGRSFKAILTKLLKYYERRNDPEEDESEVMSL